LAYTDDSAVSNVRWVSVEGRPLVCSVCGRTVDVDTGEIGEGRAKGEGRGRGGLLNFPRPRRVEMSFPEEFVRPFVAGRLADSPVSSPLENAAAA
jgi:hypothetical protein